MNTHILPIPLVSQLNHNFCGYACTSMVLKYFGIDKSMQDVANEIATPNLPYRGEENAPLDIVERCFEFAAIIREYLNDQGLDARIYSNQDWRAIKRHIDEGHALMVVVRAKEATITEHMWVVRGYHENSQTKKIIYNDPADNPADDPAIYIAGLDLITYDPDIDGLPGRTMIYHTFLTEYWRGMIPTINCMMIAVSYKGLAEGSQNITNWRGAAGRNFGSFMYHSRRLMDKLTNSEFIDAFFEGVMVSIEFVGFTLGLIQISGQILEAWGETVIDQCEEWLNGKNIGLKVFGVVASFIAMGVYIIGTILDFSGGIGGLVCEFFSGIVDGLISVFNGCVSVGKKKKIGDIEVQLGALLDVSPWRVRYGDNWEKIGGAWGILVPSGVALDKVEVRWEVSVWGWGVDRWSLSRHVNYAIGTVVRDVEGSSTNYVKRFETEITNASQFWMGFGENKCKYGKDGGLTRVKCLVEAWITHSGETKKLSVDKSVYGLST